MNPMTEFKIRCPYCLQRLDAPSDMDGQVAQCPACGNDFIARRKQTPQFQQNARSRAGAPKSANGFGVASLALGTLAALTCWMPRIGIISFLLATVGGILAIIGIVLASTCEKNRSLWHPITGMALCIVSAMLAMAFIELHDSALDWRPRHSRKVCDETTETEEVVFEIEEFCMADPEPPRPEAEQWIDAQSQAVVTDGIMVAIESVRVIPAQMVDIFSWTGLSREGCLIISVEIENRTPNKTIIHASWHGSDLSAGRDEATLSDTIGHRYKRLRFAPSDSPIGGLRLSVSPGQSVTDILQFEPPVKGSGPLRLVLPTGNFGGNGVLRFEIPGTMLEPRLYLREGNKTENGYGTQYDPVSASGCPNKSLGLKVMGGIVGGHS